MIENIKIKGSELNFTINVVLFHSVEILLIFYYLLKISALNAFILTHTEKIRMDLFFVLGLSNIIDL